MIIKEILGGIKLWLQQQGDKYRDKEIRLDDCSLLLGDYMIWLDSSSGFTRLMVYHNINDYYYLDLADPKMLDRLLKILDHHI